MESIDKTIEEALRTFYAAARDNEAPTGCEQLAKDALQAWNHRHNAKE